MFPNLRYSYLKQNQTNFSHSELGDEDGNDKCQENVSGCGVKNLKKEREGDVFQV